MGHRSDQPRKLKHFFQYYRWPEAVVAVLSVVLLALEFGLEKDALLPPGAFLAVELGALILLAGHLPVIYYFSHSFRRGFKRCGAATVFSTVLLLGLLYALGFGVRGAFEGWVKASLLIFSALAMFRELRVIQRLRVSPLMLFAGSYCLVIFAGAGVLMLPRATVEGVEMNFVDALFMSSSASCVTGLTLFDVGRAFTPFGQWVLLALFQIGGLGIMTFAAFLSIAFGSGMSIRDRAAMGEVLNLEVIGRIGRIITWILGITFALEALGAAVMYGNWIDDAGVPLAGFDQLYYSIFHSVSAFCNAGFALHTDSLVRYQGRLPVMLPMSILIIVGGIGFTVIIDLLRYKPWHHPTARRLPVVGQRLRRHPLPRLSLQTKLVLVMTLGLLVFGTLIFWLLERDGMAAQGMDTGEQLMGAFFQGGVTPRTAGFNSMDYGGMSPSTWYITILLMVVGASPGSTGGGLKTTSIALLLLALFNMFRSRPVEVFKRRITDDQVRRVLVVLVTGLILINSAVFILTVTDPQIVELDQGFERLTFEVVSAISTVGLTTGITEQFSDTGRMILALCMFLGRIGPLTLVLAIAARRPAAFDYPKESIMLG